MLKKSLYKKWHTIFTAIVSATAIVSTLYLVLREFPTLTSNPWGNISFFLMVNINIVILLILCFLVIRSIVKLLLDRKKNILGAKLRTKLVSSFVGLSLIPTVLLFLVAKGLIEKVLEEWFSPQVSSVVSSSIELANNQYREYEESIRAKTLALAKDITEKPLIEACLDKNCINLYYEEIRQLLENKLKQYDFLEIQLNLTSNKVISVIPKDEFRLPKINETNLEILKDGKVTTLSETYEGIEFLRNVIQIPLVISTEEGVIVPQNVTLITTTRVPDKLQKLLTTLVDSYDDYNELKTYHRPLSSGYFLMLLVVTLLIIFSAMWIGLYLAKQLSIPLGMLAQATSEIAQGNLDYSIPELGDDELTVLVKSFNKMTKDLKEITSELVQRRRYMEAVLASLGIGVISFDMNNIITTCNSAGKEILGIAHDDLVEGRSLKQFLPPDVIKKFGELARELFTCDEQVIVSNISIGRNHTLRHFQVTLTKLVDDQGTNLGAVALCDDLTELVHAQRLAAWREVAKRIAHEIKNPLTPIQLCAERIQRRVGNQQINPADCKVINDCTQTIIMQVESMRLLVNEFSQFARMPRSRQIISDLNQLVKDTVAIYQNSHPRINYILDLDPLLQEFIFDKEQMQRVIINILDNSITSIENLKRNNVNNLGEIIVKTKFNAHNDSATLTITDNGIGIADHEKTKLFEPNFSRKKGGTGLGLSIVHAVISDHKGSINVLDNYPQGLSMIINLPISKEQRPNNHFSHETQDNSLPKEKRRA